MKLQKIRKEKNLTQKQLAALSNVPIKIIQKYEIGNRNINGANLNYLCGLAMALDVKFYELLEDEILIEKIKATV